MKKKLYALIIGLAMVCSLVACGNTASEEVTDVPETVVSESLEIDETKEDIVPDSVDLAAVDKEETEDTGLSESEETELSEEMEENEVEPEGGKTIIAYFSHTGNTEEIAVEINALVGGDLVEIIETDPYPSAYQECVDRAEQEKNEDARPGISTVIENMEEYDTLYVGYPIWWHDAPMIIYTFLESYDLSGKTVIPFCTSSSDDVEVSMPAINSICANATILKGLTADGPEDVEGWLSEIGMMD